MKRCTNCQRTLPYDRFSFRTPTAGGAPRWQSWCRECSVDRSQARDQQLRHEGINKRLPGYLPARPLREWLERKIRRLGALEMAGDTASRMDHVQDERDLVWFAGVARAATLIGMRQDSFSRRVYALQHDETQSVRFDFADLCCQRLGDGPLTMDDLYGPELAAFDEQEAA